MGPVKALLAVRFLYILGALNNAVVGSESQDGLRPKLYNGALSRKRLQRSSDTAAALRGDTDPSAGTTSQYSECDPNFCMHYSDQLRGGDITDRQRCFDRQASRCTTTVAPIITTTEQSATTQVAASDTTVAKTTVVETTVATTTVATTTVAKTTAAAVEAETTTAATTVATTTTAPATTVAETTVVPTTAAVTTAAATAVAETTAAETIVAETTVAETTTAATTIAETTAAETTVAETTVAETTAAVTTVAETTVPEVTSTVKVLETTPAADVSTVTTEGPTTQQVDRQTTQQVTSSTPKITTTKAAALPPKVVPTVAKGLSKEDEKQKVRVVLRKASSKSPSAEELVKMIKYLQWVFNFYFTRLRDGGRFRRAVDVGDDIEILTLPSSPQTRPDGSVEIEFVARNKTTNEIIPKEVLLKILADPAFKKKLEENGYDLVEYGPDPLPEKPAAKPTAEPAIDEKDETIFEAHMGLWIAMMVIAAICIIIIIIGIIYMCCRHGRHGFWTPGKGKGLMSDPERGENGQGNPIPDDEMVKDEQPMLEKEVPNGNGVPITKLDEENGWVVPIDELTVEEKEKPEVEDTRL